jgi:hypothetical protein
LNIAYTIVLSIFHFCLLSAFAAEREKKFLSGALAVAPKNYFTFQSVNYLRKG